MFLPIPFSSLLHLTSLFHRNSSPLSPSLQNDWSKKPLLRLNKDNTFHISIFSDLHFGENEDSFGYFADIKTVQEMSGLLGVEKPNFVVVNGDLITGENTFLENSTHYVDTIASVLQNYSIPFASTYGNHDSQYNLSREALFQREITHPLSYTQHSPPGVEGVTNYYLPLYPYIGNKPIAMLWMFDSGGGFPFQVPPDSEILPDWVTTSAVGWFNASKERIPREWGIEELPPSLAFVHIPPSAFAVVQNTTLPDVNVESAVYPGLNADLPLAFEGSGAGEDYPFLAALASTPRLSSVYSGHDHGDSWCANFPGAAPGEELPKVCFCKHTGYGGYGTWRRGSREVVLKVDGEGRMEVDTWIRMDPVLAGGEVVQKVSLNETYGIDVYGVSDGEV